MHWIDFDIYSIRFLGSIWTFMLKMNEESNSCKIVFDQDSESNKVNIMWLIPQYVIITFSEVLNSATGNEFVYTQVSSLTHNFRISFNFLALTWYNIFFQGTSIDEIGIGVNLVSYNMYWEYSRRFLCWNQALANSGISIKYIILYNCIVRTSEVYLSLGNISFCRW